MKYLKKYFQVFLLVFMAFFVTQPTELEGTVRLVGTSLFPSLVFTTPEGKDYFFDDELFNSFVEYQHRRLVLSITEMDDEIWELADGSRKFVRPTIYKAEILEVKQ